MDEETRNEIETVKNRISELASCIRTLQRWTKVHDKALGELQQTAAWHIKRGT